MTFAPHPFGSAGVDGFGFGGLLVIVFWLLVIGVAMWLFTLARNTQGALATMASGQTLLVILKERYAKSEITKEQSDQMCRDLGA